VDKEIGCQTSTNQVKVLLNLVFMLDNGWNDELDEGELDVVLTVCSRMLTDRVLETDPATTCQTMDTGINWRRSSMGWMGDSGVMNRQVQAATVNAGLNTLQYRTIKLATDRMMTLGPLSELSWEAGCHRSQQC
jgi:hypothetical protein